jgi:hypothetical protein
MKHPFLPLALVALAAAASAQQDLSARIRPIAGPVRDAGIYHAATDTWTRKASFAAIGADVIYDNTAASGYFTALSGDAYVDEGRLPSTTSPTNLSSRPGCATQYTIDGVQFGYCTDDPAGGGFALAFYETYVACSTVIGVPPQATIAIAGPGPSGIGAIACWVVTIDLDAPPPTSFVMRADGNGVYNGSDSVDRFGWRIASTLPAGVQFATGPFIAGDPNTALRWDGTRWDNPVNYAEAGTGMGTADQFRIESGLTTPGCYFFPGTTFASFHLELYADACGPGVPPGTTFCFGDGTGQPCPCANHGITGNGCANSLFATGANLGLSGLASLSNDTLVLTTTQTPNSSVLFFQGTIQQNAGAGAAFGDGKRCAGGTVIRLGTKSAVANTASYPGAGDPSVSVRGMILAPGVRTYQGWYRNAATYCTTATFNLTNGIEIAWTG